MKDKIIEILKSEMNDYMKAEIIIDLYSRGDDRYTLGYTEGYDAHRLDVKNMKPHPAPEIREEDEFGPVDLTDVQPDNISKGAKPMRGAKIKKVFRDNCHHSLGGTKMLNEKEFKAALKELNR